MVNMFPGPTSRTPPGDVIEIARQFADITMLPCIQLDAVRRPTSVFDSKFGGIPYLPPGFGYPRDENPSGTRQPLKLLAQLNFATLPQVDWAPTQWFPAKGIMQFYITNEPDEDVYGVDFDDPTNQQGFRVVYHEDVIDDVSQLQQPPRMPDGNLDSFPFVGEFGLDATVAKMPMSPLDYRFDSLFKARFEDVALPHRLGRTIDEVKKHFASQYSWRGHRIGGYPFFAQYDIRDYDARGGETFPQMLLQIDTVGKGPDQIIWGNGGVANFFVDGAMPIAGSAVPYDLFRVMYNWDGV